MRIPLHTPEAEPLAAPAARGGRVWELERVLKHDADSVRGNVYIPERGEDEQDHRLGYSVIIIYRYRAGFRV